MEVLSNGIRASVPPSYPFGAVVANRIVGEGECEVNGHYVSEVNEAVHLVINSIEYWNLEVIAGIYLWGHEHAPIFNFWPFPKFNLNFLEELKRGP